MQSDNCLLPVICLSICQSAICQSNCHLFVNMSFVYLSFVNVRVDGLSSWHLYVNMTFVCLSVICLSICHMSLAICPSICLLCVSLCLSICPLSVYMSFVSQYVMSLVFCLPIMSFVCVSICHLSINLSFVCQYVICLSLCQSVSCQSNCHLKTDATKYFSN